MGRAERIIMLLKTMGYHVDEREYSIRVQLEVANGNKVATEIPAGRFFDDYIVEKIVAVLNRHIKEEIYSV